MRREPCGEDESHKIEGTGFPPNIGPHTSLSHLPSDLVFIGCDLGNEACADLEPK